MNPNLIVVTGMPGTGKTTLARGIGKALSLPLIEKDRIKETLFDDLGWSGREWSKKVGVATYGIMDYFVEQMLTNKQSLIIESNFKPEFDNHKFQSWQTNFGCAVTQIVCSADRQVLYDRFKARAATNERHPGHVDTQSDAEWRDYFLSPANTVDPLDVPSKTITVDTTTFEPDMIENVVNQIRGS